MWRSGNDIIESTDYLKLGCDECSNLYRFVQQAGFPELFLPICNCRNNLCFRIPNHIPKSQYKMYMLKATTNKNKIEFL
jgi:hypothetical protein